jgi:Flp pilus assembly CpaF family ATPase
MSTALTYRALVDAVLPDGSRLHVVIPDLTAEREYSQVRRTWTIDALTGIYVVMSSSQSARGPRQTLGTSA